MGEKVKHKKLHFDVIRVFQAYRHRAVRRAVMIPLFGRRSAEVLRDIPKALNEVRGMWRARCVELHKAGWHALDSWTDTTYAMNCPPFGVQTTTKSRVCRRPLVCPFCFARQRVLFPFRRLETVLYGVSGPYMQGQQLWEGDRGLAVTRGSPLLKLIRPDLKVVWFRRKRLITKPAVPFDLTTAREHIAYVKDYINATRRSEADGFRAEHGCVQFDIYPLPRIGKIALVRSGVLLVPTRVPDEKAIEYVLKQPGEGRAPDAVNAEVLPASKESLCTAFTQAVRYPQQMMRGLPTWTTVTLNAMHRFRAVSVFGKVDSKVTFKKSGLPTEVDDYLKED